MGMQPIRDTKGVTWTGGRAATCRQEALKWIAVKHVVSVAVETY